MSVAASSQAGYTLSVNGVTHDVADAWIGENLLYVLRERLGLPGSKNACEQGECGACSVMVDGALVCACLVAAVTVTDAQIRTIEGFGAGFGEGFGEAFGATEDALSVVQRAFVDTGAIQCGFCTPGLVMAVEALLDRIPEPDTVTVREAISGNLCRCTGYGRVFAAIEAAIEQRR